MKILSDNNITRKDLDAIDAKQDQQLAKQNLQIKQLKVWLAVCFALNIVGIVLAVAL